MAKNLFAPGGDTAGLRSKAAQVAKDTQDLGAKMPDMFKQQAAEVIGQIGQQGITQQAASPLASGMAKNKALASEIASNKLQVQKDALETRQAGLKAEKENIQAGQDAVAAAMATISAAEERLGGVGGWMTESEKAEFTRIKDNAIANLTPDEQAVVLDAFKGA